MGKIFTWAIANIKTTIVILTALLGSVIYPAGKVIIGWAIDSTDTSAGTVALVKEMDVRKLKDIEQDTNFRVISSQLQTIIDSQIRAEERVYKELQTARQQRLSHP